MILLIHALQTNSTTGRKTVMVSPSVTQSLVRTWEEPQEPQDPREGSASAQMLIKVPQSEKKERPDQQERPDQKENQELVTTVKLFIPNHMFQKRIPKVISMNLLTWAKISLPSLLNSTNWKV